LKSNFNNGHFTFNSIKEEKPLCRCTNAEELKLFSQNLINTANTPSFLSNFEGNFVSLTQPQADNIHNSAIQSNQSATKTKDADVDSEYDARMKELESFAGKSKR
jgi:hypothetical protein